MFRPRPVMAAITTVVRRRHLASELVRLAAPRATTHQTKRLSNINDQKMFRCAVPSLFFHRGGTRTITFLMRRRDPQLVRPASPTPRETKRLSDIDDQVTLRFHVPILFFYRSGGPWPNEPVTVIRRALGEALVPYYPLAGRLKEVEGRKLAVNCTGDGVLFVEADADVRLAELEAATGMRAPFPDQLLLDVEGSSGMVNCPLLLIQVTRLLCGGVVFGLRLNHLVCDGVGIAQFISAVAELARGLPARSVAPVWCRHLLEARSSPPTPVLPNHEDEDMPQLLASAASEMVERTFTFSKADIAAIKQGLPPHLRHKATTFEALTAAIWRASTAALELTPDEPVRLAIIANFRGLPELDLPAGYYGNACVDLTVSTTAGALRAGSAGDAVELVREAKASMTAECVRASAEFLRLHRRPIVALENLFLVSDIRYAGFDRVDFGWGEPVYGGPAFMSFFGTFIIAVKDGQGEHALALPIVLPQPAMERFASEVDMMVKNDQRSALSRQPLALSSPVTPAPHTDP